MSPPKKARKTAKTHLFEDFEDNTAIGNFVAMVISRRGLYSTSDRNPIKLGLGDTKMDQREVVVWPNSFAGDNKAAQGNDFLHRFEPHQTYEFQGVQPQQAVGKYVLYNKLPRTPIHQLRYGAYAINTFINVALQAYHWSR